MLIKLGNRWVDPTTVRMVNDSFNTSQPVACIRFKRFGDMMECKGITGDEAARLINEALSNPLFYDPEG